MSYSRDEVEITLIEAEKKTASFVGIENIPALKEERVKPKIYGLTTVNLLGPFGNFENDSNSDGLADGWTNDGTLTAVTYSKTADNVSATQYGQNVALQAEGEGGCYIEVPVTAGHILFVSGYCHRPTGNASTAKILIEWHGVSGKISEDLHASKDSSSHIQYFSKYTVPEDVITMRIYLLASGPSGTAVFSDISAFNLTDMGILDPTRAGYYDVTHWSDLSTYQLKVELFNIDSVRSVNVIESPSAISIINRGKNLWYNHNGYPQHYALQPALSFDSNSITFYSRNEKTGISACGDLFWLKPGTYTISCKLSHDIDPEFVCYYINSRRYGLERELSSVYVAGAKALSGAIAGITTTKISNTEFRLTITSEWLYYLRFGNIYTEDTRLTVYDIQLEEGSAATTYVPPRSDSITIPASAELHGFGGTWDSIEDGYYNKRFTRETKTTDSSGNFVLSGYASGTVIVRNKSTGEVKVLTAAASVSTGWNMTEVEILYKLAVPLRTRLLRSINLYAGQNNILSPDSKLPLAMSLEYTDKGAEETRGFARNFREVSRTEHHEHKPMFLETSKFYKMAEEYELSWDDIFFDTDLDVAQMEKKEFFVEVLGEDDTILYSGCFIEGLNESEDDVRKQAVSIVCQERIL